MDIKFECKDSGFSEIKHNLGYIPPISSRVIFGGFAYEVIRHEFNFDNEQIEVLMIEADELGIDKTPKE